ncbi:DUF835 domain-containing protein [Thermococcus sp. 18S1]|uniref:DUF835 domain-containing protein n=1 Tax=Thermococcus sp. 18S1 TaxID=1638210 RepID=UPI003211F41C
MTEIDAVTFVEGLLLAGVSGYLLIKIRLLHRYGELHKREYSMELSVIFGLFVLAGIALMVAAATESAPPRAPDIVALTAFIVISILSMRELLRKTPGVISPKGVGIKESSVFLVESENEAKLMMKTFHLKGAPVMAISRRPYEEWVSKFGFSPKTFLWLSNVQHPHAVSPSSLYILREEAVRFMRENPGGVVYVDGIEYMTFYSEFSTIAKFLFTLRDYALTTGAYVVVLASPEALGPTKFNILAREFRRPDFGEIEDTLSEKAFFGTVRKEDLERLLENDSRDVEEKVMPGGSENASDKGDKNRS